jgi:hypothetical protein
MTILSVAIIAFAVPLLKKALRSIRKREEVQAEKIAATATSYFEGLAEK